MKHAGAQVDDFNLQQIGVKDLQAQQVTMLS